MKLLPIALLAWALPVAAVTWLPVSIDSRDRDAREQPVRLAAYLAHPAAGERKAAVVLLHGCGGLWRRAGEMAPRFGEMAELLFAEGYAVLAVDSFTPRGVREICRQPYAQRGITPRTRGADALGAYDHLVARPDIDARRIALLGWSHGGSTVLATMLGERARESTPDFAAAAAYYPGCRSYRDRGLRARAPLLLLLGGADQWTPAAHCLALHEALSAAGDPAEAHVYPGAHHGFDGADPPRVRNDVPNVPGGVTVGGEPAARDDSRRRVLDYFKRRLRG